MFGSFSYYLLLALFMFGSFRLTSFVVFLNFRILKLFFSFDSVLVLEPTKNNEKELNAFE